MSDWASGHGKSGVLSWASQQECARSVGEIISCPQLSLPHERSLPLRATRTWHRKQATGDQAVSAPRDVQRGPVAGAAVTAVTRRC